MPSTFEPGVRLRSRVEFTAVQERGRRVALRYLTLLSLPTARGTDRLGIIASRRLGNAIVRNSAKRRLREIFRHCERHVSAGGNVPSLDLVAIPKRELVTAPFLAVDAEFRRALNKSRSMKLS